MKKREEIILGRKKVGSGERKTKEAEIIVLLFVWRKEMLVYFCFGLTLLGEILVDENYASRCKTKILECRTKREV